MKASERLGDWLHLHANSLGLVLGVLAFAGPFAVLAGLGVLARSGPVHKREFVVTIAGLSMPSRNPTSAYWYARTIINGWPIVIPLNGYLDCHPGDQITLEEDRYQWRVDYQPLGGCRPKTLSNAKG